MVEQLIAKVAPFITTADGRTVTTGEIDLDATLGDNAKRLGCSVHILAQLIDAEKAWFRAEWKLLQASPEPGWTHDTPQWGRYYWHRKREDAEPVLMRVVKSYERLLAGPWAGSLEDVSKMGGLWLAVGEPP